MIGLPGDRIHLESKRVYVNGQPLTEPYARFRRGSFEEFRDNFPANPAPYNDVTPGWLRQMRALVHDGELVVPPTATLCSETTAITASIAGTGASFPERM